MVFIISIDIPLRFFENKKRSVGTLAIITNSWFMILANIFRILNKNTTIPVNVSTDLFYVIINHNILS